MSNLLNFSIMKDDVRLMRVHPGAVFMLIYWAAILKITTIWFIIVYNDCGSF